MEAELKEKVEQCLNCKVKPCTKGCPLENNIKAINCYKKCGFYIKDYFDTKDTIGIPQTYALMVKE